MPTEVNKKLGLNHLHKSQTKTYKPFSKVQRMKEQAAYEDIDNLASGTITEKLQQNAYMIE